MLKAEHFLKENEWFEIIMKKYHHALYLITSLPFLCV